MTEEEKFEQRFAAERPVLHPPVDLQLVLALQRNEDPVSGWVKVEMPGLKAEACARSDGSAPRR